MELYETTDEPCHESKTNMLEVCQQCFPFYHINKEKTTRREETVLIRIKHLMQSALRMKLKVTICDDSNVLGCLCIVART